MPQRSIRTKLMMLATASGCVALLLACLGFMSNDAQLMHQAKLREITAEAELLGFNSSVVLGVRDKVAAEQMLGALALHSSIDSAILFDSKGDRLAEFQNGSDIPSLTAAPERLGCRYDQDGRLEFVHPVMERGRRVGTLYLRSNMSDLKAQIENHRHIALWVALCSLAASIVLSFFLQQLISRPILKLADTADQITRLGDYSLRVKSPSNDELGQLYGAFNKMLDRVQVSDRALKRAHDELEERVEQRTSELVSEIRERERIQSDLRHAKEAAEAANRAKSEFLANMSHEIRTPLNAILGFADLVRQGTDLSVAEQRDYLDTIHKSGQHLLSLISDILDLSKIEAGQLTVENLRVSPHQIVAETVSVLRVRAREKGLKLDYNWVGHVPETIETDPARLRQMLLNVVGNAVKFTDNGGVHIVAQIVGKLEDPRMLLEVVDTGIGIQTNKLKDIFDPFCQADSSVTRRFGGTGLGLAICQRLAQALGGGIAVQSHPGEGSIFSISVATGSLVGVPLVEGPMSDIPRPQDEPHVKKRIALPGRRILVADDGDTNRKLIQIVLRRAGATVLCAENGQEALEIALQEQFDAILMDMQMPVMDGYTATSRLRAAGLKTPIIALTAHAMKGDEERCRESGCTGYLTKPVNAERLLTSLAAEIGGDEILQQDSVPQTGGDLGTLMSTLPLDDAEFRDIVDEFVARFQVRLLAMHKALDTNDLIELKSLAHWLKGAGGTAGFQPLTEAAFELEMALAAGDEVACTRALRDLDSLEKQIVNGLCSA
jgi:signal transduction histidine kinase/FixJ family two-component response regulator